LVFELNICPRLPDAQRFRIVASASVWKAVGDIAKHGLVELAVSVAHRTFEHRALGFVQATANGGAEVDCVGGRGSEPTFVAAVRCAEVEDVEGMAGSEGQFDVDTAGCLVKPPYSCSGSMM